MVGEYRSVIYIPAARRDSVGVSLMIPVDCRDYSDSDVSHTVKLDDNFLSATIAV